MSQIRFVGAISRRSGMSLTAFSHHWRTTHKDTLMGFVSAGIIQGYVQNHRTDVMIEGLRSDYDGSPELWIRDADALAQMASSEEFRYALEVDSPRFINMPPISFLVSETIVIEAIKREPPGTLLKLMLFIPHDHSNATQDSEWESVLKSAFSSNLLPRRLTRLTVVTADGKPDPSGIQGVECSWWKDEKELSEAWNARDRQPARGEPSILLAREEIIRRLDVE